VKLRTWLVVLFGSLLVLTGVCLSLLAHHQARQNLIRALERQVQEGARSSFEPARLRHLRILSHRILDSPAMQDYRAVFVTSNGPFQALLSGGQREKLLEQLGRARADDGQPWTRAEVAENSGNISHLHRCWLALQGLMRDTGVTLFEESEGALQLMLLTDRSGQPYLELRSKPAGQAPTAEDDWIRPQPTRQLQDALSQQRAQPWEGYYRHSDGALYLIRIERFHLGDQLVLGTRIDRGFEDSISQHIQGARFRLEGGASSDPFLSSLAQLGSNHRVLVENQPYLCYSEVLPGFDDPKRAVAQLWQFRSLDSVESYLRRMTGGIATLIAASLALGLVGIALATQPISRLIGQLSQRMQEVGQGQLGDELAPAGPLELRQAAASFNQMVQQLRHKEMLAKMVPKQAREAIESDRTEGGRVVARRIRTTILFSDIRGFTSLSERLSPQEVLHLLDIYLSRMTEIIDAHGGDVNEYIGDAILADFEDRPEAPGAQRAVTAALAMVAALEALRGQNLHPELKSLRQGLGLHTGEIVKGEVGAAHRSKFALIGDTVNLAARIQDRSRDGKHTGILLSDDSNQDVQGFQVALFGDESFKGKTGLTRVWEIVGPAGAAAPHPAAGDAAPGAGTAPTEPA